MRTFSVKNDKLKEVLLSIDIYDGRKAHYFHLKSKHSTLEQSFIDWYESVKAVPVAQ